MLKPPNNKVIIAARFDRDTSPGGIIIPEMAKDRCDQGVVKYVGSECKELKVGDYVLFPAYSGTTLRMEGEGVLIIMPEDAVACIVEGMDTEVKGLYFKGVNNEYFPATYEMMMQLVQDSFSREDYRVKTTSKKPGLS